MIAVFSLLMFLFTFDDKHIHDCIAVLCGLVLWGLIGQPDMAQPGACFCSHHGCTVSVTSQTWSGFSLAFMLVPSQTLRQQTRTGSVLLSLSNVWALQVQLYCTALWSE